MKGIIFVLCLFIIVAIPAACAPKSATLQKPLPEEGQAKLQSTTESLSGGWEVQWKKILVEAKKEGKVIVFGPPGSDIRKAMMEEFQKAYPFIGVEWIAAMGAVHLPKIKAERRAGISSVDLVMTGTLSINPEMIQFAIPIEPQLILPEVKDGKYWMDGKLDFADRTGKYNLVFSTFGKIAIAYNPALLDSRKAQEMSYWDLTKPELRGKIIIRDPRTTGPGLTTFMFFYAHPQLGPDMIKALAKNDIVLSREERQALEFVSRGKFALANGFADIVLDDLRKTGIRDINTQPSLKEGTYLTAGQGSLVLFDNPPHPNAAIVYTNWLLSKEGQTAWSISSETHSRRIDVPTTHLDPEILIKPGVNYFSPYREELFEVRDKVMPLLYELFGR